MKEGKIKEFRCIKGIKNKQETLEIKEELDKDFQKEIARLANVVNDKEVIQLKGRLNKILLENHKKEKTLNKILTEISAKNHYKDNEDCEKLKIEIHEIKRKTSEEDDETKRLNLKLEKLSKQKIELAQLLNLCITENKKVEENQNLLIEQKIFFSEKEKTLNSQISNFKSLAYKRSLDFEDNFLQLEGRSKKLKGESLKLCSSIAEMRKEKKKLESKKKEFCKELKSHIEGSVEIQENSKKILTKISHFQYYFSKVNQYLKVSENMTIELYSEKIIEWLKVEENRSISLSMHFLENSKILEKLKLSHQGLTKAKENLISKSKNIISQVEIKNTQDEAKPNNLEILILSVYSRFLFLFQHIYIVFTKIDSFLPMQNSMFSSILLKIEKQIKNLKIRGQPKKNFPLEIEQSKDSLIYTINSINSPIIQYFSSADIIEYFLLNGLQPSISDIILHYHKLMKKSLSKHSSNLLKLLKQVQMSIKGSSNSQSSSISHKNSLKYYTRLRTSPDSKLKTNIMSVNDLNVFTVQQVKNPAKRVKSNTLFPLDPKKEQYLISQKLHSLRVIKKNLSKDAKKEDLSFRLKNKYIIRNDSTKRLYKIRSNSINFTVKNLQ